MELLRGIANVWSLGLVAAVAATLAWFVYATCLRKLWRVRRIANIRLQRMLAENKQGDEGPHQVFAEERRLKDL